MEDVSIDRPKGGFGLASGFWGPQEEAWTLSSAAGTALLARI